MLAVEYVPDEAASGAATAIEDGEMRAVMHSRAGRKRRWVRMDNLLRLRDEEIQDDRLPTEWRGRDLAVGGRGRRCARGAHASAVGAPRGMGRPKGRPGQTGPGAGDTRERPVGPRNSVGGGWRELQPKGGRPRVRGPLAGAAGGPGRLNSSRS